MKIPHSFMFFVSIYVPLAPIGLLFLDFFAFFRVKVHLLLEAP
jgi:hypothetical protein